VAYNDVDRGALFPNDDSFTDLASEVRGSATLDGMMRKSRREAGPQVAFLNSRAPRCPAMENPLPGSCCVQILAQLRRSAKEIKNALAPVGSRQG
jgi:hypothetical protein